MKSMKAKNWRAVLLGMLALTLAAGCSSYSAPADPTGMVVYTQPAHYLGGLIPSAWVSPGGSDGDAYAYDSFVLGDDTSVREVRWRGGYATGASYGHVTDFTITFYASAANDTQPNCTNPHLSETNYLASYQVGGNAGETVFENVGGTTMYDYAFVLPTPFQASAGTKYWLRIEALQRSLAD